MASRKDQKEALRREREAREREAQDAQRRKRLVGFGIGGALALAAVVVLVVLLVSGGGGGGDDASAELLPDGGEVPRQQVTDLERAAEAAGCELSSRRARSRDHTQDPNEAVEYPTKPPTSGKHFVEAAPDGAFGDPPPRDEEIVHTLEHGRVIFWFEPTLPEEQRANLKALFDSDSYQMVLVPKSRMEAQIAASAWNRDPDPLGTGRLLSCPRYNEKVFDALRTFRDEHRSNGPEPVP